MIYIFCGEDTFESYLQSTLFIKKQKKLYRDYEYISIDGSQKNINEIILEEEQYNMFKSNKIVFIRRLIENNPKEINFETLQKLENSSNIYILWEDNNEVSYNTVKKLKALLDSMEKTKDNKKLFIYNKIKDFQYINWVIEMFKVFGITIHHDIAMLLTEFNELDKGILYQEIKKIGMYSIFIGKKTIDVEIVYELTTNTKSGNIWKFLDYFGNRNKKFCLLELEKLMKYEDIGQYIITMITRELKYYLLIKTYLSKNKDVSSIDLHPYALKKFIEKQKNFTVEEIEKLIIELLKIDLYIKTGICSEYFGLTKYLYQNL
ncbi:MAG: hypothetical protein NZZ41_03710 [Candidatus Dojkabacteria bacterium]|nr:hypothetical protein [Candidatus Dojkabacteria bacterium]